MYLYHCGSGDGNEESKSGAVENSEKVHRSFNDILTLFSFVTKFLTLLQVLYLRRLQSQRFDHSYRQIMDPIIRPLVGESPVLGIHLGLRNSDGIVRVGDPVYVGLPEEQPLLISPP